jgi:hypothetical protein
MGLREIGKRVGLHFSAMGNAVQRVADNPTRLMVQSLRELERKFKNQESSSLTLDFTAAQRAALQLAPAKTSDQ